MNIQRITAVAFKEWREIIRDRLFLSLAFIVPALLMVVFGFGLSLDVENVPFTVLDHDRSPMSRDYVHRFVDSRYFDFKGYARSERDLDVLLADNKVRLALVIPEGFQERLLDGRPAGVQALIDGTFPYRTRITKGYLIAINSAVSTGLLADHLAQTQGLTPEQARATMEPVSLEARYLYNQPVKSAWSITPALIMFVLMITPPFLTAVGIVREKESGSIYNIYASTVSRGEFLIGKLSPYVVISSLNVIVLWLISIIIFGAPFKGSLPFFFFASVIYVTCTTGIGLLVSLLVRTQVAAMIVTAILAFVPSIFYSGFLIPVSSLGTGSQVIARFFPGMHYTTISQGSFLKGVGSEVLWSPVLFLAIYAVVMFGLGYFLFHKRLRA